jgi:Iron/manganese superoxide dismutases, alpha-hairpin domain
MSFSLPELPYAYDALAPCMSRETLEYHHDKHHLAYVNNGNNLAKGTEWENKPVEEVVIGTFGKDQGLLIFTDPTTFGILLEPTGDVGQKARLVALGIERRAPALGRCEGDLGAGILELPSWSCEVRTIRTFMMRSFPWSLKSARVWPRHSPVCRSWSIWRGLISRLSRARPLVERHGTGSDRRI